EGDAAAAGDYRAAPPRILIHQDEGVPRWDERRDSPQPPANLVPPGIRSPPPRVRRNAQGLTTAAQSVETILLAPQAGAQALLERVAQAMVLAVVPPAALRLRNSSYGSEEGSQAAQIEVWRSTELLLGDGKDPFQEQPRPGVAGCVRPEIAVGPLADHG